MFFFHLLMLFLKYMVIYYSHVTFSFKWTVNTKILICNSVLTISACIYLFHIFLQSMNNKLSSSNGSFSIRKRKVLPFSKNQYSNQEIGFYDITKYWKINITQIFFASSLPIYMCSFFWLLLFHTSTIDNCAKTWELSIIQVTSIFLQIFLTTISIFPPQ